MTPPEQAAASPPQAQELYPTHCPWSEAQASGQDDGQLLGQSHLGCARVVLAGRVVLQGAVGRPCSVTDHLLEYQPGGRPQGMTILIDWSSCILKELNTGSSQTACIRCFWRPLEKRD